MQNLLEKKFRKAVVLPCKNVGTRILQVALKIKNTDNIIEYLMAVLFFYLFRFLNNNNKCNIISIINTYWAKWWTSNKCICRTQINITHHNNQPNNGSHLCWYVGVVADIALLLIAFWGWSKHRYALTLQTCASWQQSETYSIFNGSRQPAIITKTATQMK